MQLYKAKALEKLDFQLLRRFKVASVRPFHVNNQRIHQQNSLLYDSARSSRPRVVYPCNIMKLNTLSSSKCDKTDQLMLLCMLKQSQMDFSGNLCIRSYSSRISWPAASYPFDLITEKLRIRPFSPGAGEHEKGSKGKKSKKR